MPYLRLCIFGKKGARADCWKIENSIIARQEKEKRSSNPDRIAPLPSTPKTVGGYPKILDGRP